MKTTNVDINKLSSELVESFGYNPLLAIQANDGQSIPEGSRIFEDSLSVLEKYGVQFLIPLLESENENTVINALHVFSELGEQAKCLVEHVIKYIQSKDESARWYVVEGVLPYVSELPLQYIAMCLAIANDDLERNRKKAIDLIAALPEPLIEQALKLIEVEKEEHLRGLEILSEEIQGKELMQNHRNLTKVSTCYFFAKIIKLGKKGIFTEMGECNSKKSLHFYIKQRLEILKKRKALRFGSL